MKVMIVEDEQIEALALQKILKQNYPDVVKRIQICKDGREAIIQSGKESFDIIFMDINMPFIDGVSAATQIRIKDKKVIIIMLTAYSDFNYAKASIENQVFAYITKPYSVKTLRAVMNKVMSIYFQTEKNVEECIENLILTHSLEEIESYVERLLVTKDNQDNTLFKDKIHSAMVDIIQMCEYYISGREKDKLLQLAKDRIQKPVHLLPEELKTDCVYLLQMLSDQICSAMDFNEDDIIVQTKKYINLHYEKDIKLSDIADSVAISKFYLSRIFKVKTGENIKDYILRVRLEKAKRLLQRNYNIKEVAYKTGFNNPSYFSKCFKKEMKISPGEYKDRQEQNDKNVIK